MKEKYLWMVILLPAFWFGFDKIFGLEIVKDYTIPWKKIEILFYESKEDLLDVYTKNLPEHKKDNLDRAVILGSSRSGEFSPHIIRKSIPNLVSYNFSAPLAGPAFHYYWLQKVHSVDPDLKLVILETDPVMFSKSTLTYTLNYGLDTNFVLENSNFFSERFLSPWDAGKRKGFQWDEVETFLTKNLFISYKYPPDPNAIRDNRKETFMVVDTEVVAVSGKEYKRNFSEIIHKANRLEYGAIPNQIHHQGDLSFIKKDALNMASTYFGDNFQPSLTQVVFFKKTLRFLAEHNIKAILYWPLVSESFREEMEKRGLVDSSKESIIQEIAKVKKEYPNVSITLLDVHDEKDLKCRAFIDSLHLSGACYPELFSFFKKAIQ